METFTDIILIAIGGGSGAVTRAFLSRFIKTEFPWSTIKVNIIGSFLIGFVLELCLESTYPNHLAVVLIVEGFLGAFTTFSSFSYHTFYLFKKGRIFAAAANIFLSLLIALVAVWLGIECAKMISS